MVSRVERMERSFVLLSLGKKRKQPGNKVGINSKGWLCAYEFEIYHSQMSIKPSNTNNEWWVSMQLLHLHCFRMSGTGSVASIFTGGVTKTVTLSEIIARASGILLSGRHVPFFKSPLHGPNTQRSHVRQRAKVAISNNSLWSLETHSKSLKTSVVYTTSCFEALVHQTLEKEGFWASFLINFPYVNRRMIFQKSDTILSTSWIIAAATA